jgi:hypothetical protein
LSGFDQTKSGLLYYIAVATNDGGTLYKIGITNLSIKRRFSRIDRDRIIIVKTWKFVIGPDAAERETKTLRQFSGYRYYGPDILIGAGNTELKRATFSIFITVITMSITASILKL